MQQGQQHSVRPPSYLRVSERARDAMAVASGANLPPARRTWVRKWRSSGGQPSPLERTASLMVEMHGCGVRVEVLRAWPRFLDDVLNDLAVGVARPILTPELYRREADAQNAEDAATMRAIFEDTVEAHEAAARAEEAEAAVAIEKAKAHRARARELARAR